jgi:hypothetical protein
MNDYNNVIEHKQIDKFKGVIANVCQLMLRHFFLFSSATSLKPVQKIKIFCSAILHQYSQHSNYTGFNFVLKVSRLFELLELAFRALGICLYCALYNISAPRISGSTSALFVLKDSTHACNWSTLT